MVCDLSFGCTFCTYGAQENASIGLIVFQSAEILGLIICLQYT